WFRDIDEFPFGACGPVDQIVRGIGIAVTDRRGEISESSDEPGQSVAEVGIAHVHCVRQGRGQRTTVVRRTTDQQSPPFVTLPASPDPIPSQWTGTGQKCVHPLV